MLEWGQDSSYYKLFSIEVTSIDSGYLWISIYAY